MANVLHQWIYDLDKNNLPLSQKQKNSVQLVTWMVGMVLDGAKGKTLSEVIDTLYRELPVIEKQSWLQSSSPDANGNITTTLGDDVRLALAIGIYNSATNNIVLFGRKEGEKLYDESGNKNPLLDLPVAAKAILSKGSTAFKVGDAYLAQVLDSLNFTGKFAYEQTNGDGDAQHIIMPVFAGTTATNIALPDDKKVQVYSLGDLKNLNPEELTAKARAYQQSL